MGKIMRVSIERKATSTTKQTENDTNGRNAAILSIDGQTCNIVSIFRFIQSSVLVCG
jgi:hypothetical protein